MTHPFGNIFDLPELRERERVFKDRHHAGEILAGMLGAFRQTNGIVLGIPAGGVPVGAAAAGKLNLPFDLAVVSKITLPWNTEAGYGAVAFDGTWQLNEDMLRRIDLTREDIREGIARTHDKVTRRVETLRGGKALPDLTGRPVILIDDGLASGFTMRTAVAALRNAGAGRVVAAVPTGHRRSVDAVSAVVEAVYCPNVRGGLRYAVASAYEHWYDVTEAEVIRILSRKGNEMEKNTDNEAVEALCPECGHAFKTFMDRVLHEDAIPREKEGVDCPVCGCGACTIGK